MFKDPVTSSRSPARRPVLLTAGALAAAASIFLFLWWRHGGAMVDDAYISFRYAARWAAGSGLSWNGGAPVEGFSNPLWTLILGGLARAGMAPHLAAPWLGLASFLGTVALCGRLGTLRAFPGPALLLLVGGVAADLGLAVWAGSGLETASCALFIAAWLVAAAGLSHPDRPGGSSGIRRGLLLGLLSSALVISRPEGALWVLGGLWLLWGAWVGKRVLLGWGLGLGPALAYGVFRWMYYGALLPNTFFAKMEPAGSSSLGHGAQDVTWWALAHVVPLALILGGGLWRRPRPAGGPASASPRWWLILPSGWVVLQILFVLGVGGDWMGRARYLAPVLPAVYLLAAEAWTRTLVRVPRPALAAGLLLGVHLLMGWTGRDVIPDYVAAGRAVGEWLHSAAAPDDTVAVTAAGAIPYFAEIPAYDVLGINDPEVAGRRPRHTGPWAPGHHRYDLDRLLELRPRWIVWDFGILVNEHRLRQLRDDRGDPDRLDYRRALLARPEFRRLYVIDRGVPAATQRAYTVFRLR